MEIVNPSNGNVIKKVKTDTSKSVYQKAEMARRAQKEWSLVSFENRLNVLAKFNSLLSEHAKDCAAIMSEETGKPISQAMNEVSATLGRVEWFLNNSEPHLGEEHVFEEGNTAEKITYEPLGVVANISAWNYPYFVGTNVFIPALLLGNSVLYKPSEFALGTGLKIGELLHSAGVPKDVFQVLLGGSEVGQALCDSPVDGIFFTGSYKTGAAIAKQVAGKMIKLQMELGGKDPVYVCEDVDIANAAASLADGAFYNCGQSCCAVERIYVHSKIFREFLSEFKKVVQSFKVGDPAEDSTYIGPLTRGAQIEVLNEQVRDAVKKGASLVLGGKSIVGEGAYYEPTVLTDVSHEMLVMKEESFGPIIGIQSVDSDDEAISLMLDTPYGLTSGVFTQDKNRAENILQKMNSGSVYWNCCDRVSPHLPWSGRGHSGMGATLSKWGITTFLKPKAWHLRTL